MNVHVPSPGSAHLPSGLPSAQPAPGSSVPAAASEPPRTGELDRVVLSAASRTLSEQRRAHDAEVARVAAAAQRRAEELRRMRRELRFEINPDTGRVRVEVRDGDGNVIRHIPMTETPDLVRRSVNR